MKLSFPNFIAPFYHTVSDVPLPHIDPLYHRINVSRFRADLEFLSKGYRFISARELLERVEEPSHTEEKIAFLSFDDGLKECHTVILPILKEMNIPATFFINPTFIDNQEIFYRYKAALIMSNLIQSEDREVMKLGRILDTENTSILKLKRTLIKLKYQDSKKLNEGLRLFDINTRELNIYMSTSDIQNLCQSGFDIGAHGMDHRNFDELTMSEAADQVRSGISYCKSVAENSPGLFAFPFYDFHLGKEIYHKMYPNWGVDLSFGTSGPKEDTISRSIQRIPMEVATPSIISLMKNIRMKYLLNKLLDRNKLKRD